jgi:hypothetical protein
MEKALRMRMIRMGKGMGMGNGNEEMGMENENGNELLNYVLYFFLSPRYVTNLICAL